ncbi:agmatine deiminase [uncultured Gemmiger sp.]|uniref:agmatine deiminase n=1 Tax=uncultured Gemmiger sp. TaxID=1623490 RepID=UPI0025DB0CB9|nr:agmatine deiminase [uncultured Gemmiger sp.]
MVLLSTLPAADGFAMPAEFAPHKATVLIWPVRPGSWGRDPSAAQRAFLDVIREIANGEDVYLLAGAADLAAAKAAAAGIPRVTVFEIESDDAWARDVGPTFVTNGKILRGISWKFNAWGGEVDGLYAQWDKDDAVAAALCDRLGVDCYDAGDFVLEGGSIHTDGEGTLLTTEACLLSAGRNPGMTREQIAQKLAGYLGIRKVLWLPRGIYQDETNEHVDNVCAFTAPGEVVLAWTDDQNDPQYTLSKACLDYLESVTDAAGRRLKVRLLPIPDHPICCTAADCAAYDFAPGEDMREPGDRLAGSYANFYIANSAVLVPQFGGENAASDARALDILREAFPGRRVVGIDARTILLGGGNIHCITQQVPLV